MSTLVPKSSVLARRQLLLTKDTKRVLHKTRLVDLIIGHNFRFRSPERVSTVDYGRQHTRGSPECGLGLRTSRTQARVISRRP